MGLHAVNGCCVQTCERKATIRVQDNGKDWVYFCEPCWEIVERVLELTSAMVKHGTPRQVAAEWASAKVHKELEAG